MRSGDHYLASLDDGRAVFLDGERVGDVTKHPAFAEPIRRVAHTWDLARAPEAQPTTTYVDPATGRRYSTMWLVPRSADDLGARRRAGASSSIVGGRASAITSCASTSARATRTCTSRTGSCRSRSTARSPR